MSDITYSVTEMTVETARKLGIQRYRDGYTFAAHNVRPAGFFMACLAAKRLDLVAALDEGWHVANLAEPVQLDDGTVIVSSRAAARLEEICNS